MKRSWPKLPMFVDSAVCSDCGGQCCKSAPGITAPEDWGAPDRATMATRLRAAFASLDYAIDWWVGDPRPRGKLDRVLFVRPATTLARGELYDPSWGAPCSLLGPTGCKLDHDARPYECRALKPVQAADRSNGHGCKGYTSKRAMSLLWIPYQSVIEMAAGGQDAS